MKKPTMFENKRPLLIAEIGQNHDGSLGQAHAFIDAVAGAGADAVKFQTHFAAEESTSEDQFRVSFSYEDATRYDYWERMEFSEEQWAALKSHAEDAGLIFLSSPFSKRAVELLDRLGVQAWKVGSGDTGGPIFEMCLATGRPIIASTGMSNWDEVDRLYERLNEQAAPFAIMHCTSKYPTPAEDVGLNIIEEMRQRYSCRIGLSDHSGSTTPSIAALARGVDLIEVHVTFDRRMFGPDVSSSLTVEEFGQVAKFSTELGKIDANPIDKDKVAENLASQRDLFARSVALVGDLPEGHVLSEDDLAAKKPGTGIAWSNRDQLVGRTLANAVPANRLLRMEDIL